ncbi:hypothetical protein [Brachymonas chironomi]|uniref:hypothetical protein n=1 Tax=Brachymonas chironomi TaxID=491919 RepID=UPI0012E9E28D|nr:hypothetical protein [Brachymonas chironomi]
MSLEQDLQAAIAAQNALTQEVAGKVALINASVAEARRAILENVKTVYVSPLGVDTASGDAGAPVKTIVEACKRAPLAGLLSIILDNSGTTGASTIFKVDSSINLSFRNIIISALNPTGTKPTIRMMPYVDSESTKIYRYWVNIGGSNLTFENTIFETASAPVGNMLPLDTGGTLIGSGRGGCFVNFAPGSELHLGDFSLFRPGGGVEFPTIGFRQASIKQIGASNPRIIWDTQAVRLQGSVVTLQGGLTWATDPAAPTDLIGGVRWKNGVPTNVLTNLF